MPFEVGAEYLAQSVLAQRVLGTVWRGEGPLGAVAITVLRHDITLDQRRVAGVLAQRERLQALDGRHLVPVRDVVADGKRLALVTDIPAGDDLGTYLSEHASMAAAEAVALLAPLAAALGLAHRAGVVHGDIRAANVLLTTLAGERVARLAGFGVSPLVSAADEATGRMAVGDEQYLSPEVLRGDSPAAASDVYALGILLYELVTGSTPFAAEDPAEIRRGHLQDAPRRPVHVPAALWSVVVQCLAKTSSRRPDAATLASLLAAAVERLAAGEDDATHPLGSDRASTPLVTSAAALALASPAAPGPAAPAAAGTTPVSLAPSASSLTSPPRFVHTAPPRPTGGHRKALFVLGGWAALFALAGVIHLAESGHDGAKSDQAVVAPAVSPTPSVGEATPGPATPGSPSPGAAAVPASSRHAAGSVGGGAPAGSSAGSGSVASAANPSGASRPRSTSRSSPPAASGTPADPPSTLADAEPTWSCGAWVAHNKGKIRYRACVGTTTSQVWWRTDVDSDVGGWATADSDLHAGSGSVVAHNQCDLKLRKSDVATCGPTVVSAGSAPHPVAASTVLRNNESPGDEPTATSS